MLNRVLQAIPENVRKNFYDNVAGFRKAWDNEVIVKASLRKNEISLVGTVENCNQYVDSKLKESILGLNKEISDLSTDDEHVLFKALRDDQRIFISLRTNERNEMLVGYVKGGPLEKYKLRRGTHDENNGKITQHI